MNFKELPNYQTHLIVRFFTVIFTLALPILTKHFTKIKWLKIFRLFWPLLLLGYFYKETDYLNNLIFNNLDPFFASIEIAIFKQQLANKFSEVIPNNLFAELMYFGYFSYYLLIIGIPVYTFIKLGFKKAENVLFIVINSFLIYYLVFIAIPVAGPQFYFDQSISTLPSGYIFGWLIKFIQSYGEAPTAAFPSSHVSICLMLVWICYKHFRKMLTIVIPIAILLILSTVYIKAHYAIDIIAAFITTPLVYKLSDKIYVYFNKKKA
ncbi:MAG: phosphatase PAP2 family protein [Salinivirgaceae bacterium]|nr:phosphatase PAP2 family protein [Salinivirgaceae bacterium]